MAGTNLEDDGPAPVATPDPPAATVPDPAVVPPEPDEQSAVEMQGGKYVPLDALKATRAELKVAKEAASQMETLRQQNAQLMGSLQTFQHLQQQMQRPATEPIAATPVDPSAEMYARSLDYYKADGTPDLDRGGKFAALVRQEATKLAQQAIEPYAQQTQQERAAVNFQRALATKAPNGMQPKSETLTWMFQNLPASMTSDPRTAQMLPALAIGLDVLSGQRGAPPSPAAPLTAPVVTEASGGGPSRPRSPGINDVERAIIANRNMDEKRYGELTKGFRPGRSNVLEDE